MHDRHFQHWPDDTPRHLDVLPASPYDSLLTAARVHGSKRAIGYYGMEMTYAQLQVEVERLARYLVGTGVSTGDRVLLCVQNSPQFVIAFYALSAARAVIVPVNPMSRTDEISYLVEDTSAALVIAGQEKLEDLRPLLKGGLQSVVVVTYSDYLPLDPAPDLPDVVTAPAVPLDDSAMTAWTQALETTETHALPAGDPEAICVIAYTSGTTGHPKGSMLSNRSTLTPALASALWLGSDETTVQLVTVPLFHVTGMQICMTGGIMAGNTLHLLTRWDCDLAIDLVERHGITLWIAIAAMVVDFVNTEGLDRRDLSSLAMIMGGGAAMPEAVAAKLRELTGLDYVEGYGLSETASAVLINPPQRPKRACLGIPLMDVDARVIDVDTLAELGTGDTGEIVVNAPQVFQGYWQRPEATKEAFMTLDGKPFFRTGDLGYRDNDGYFFMVDRLKRMINAAGYKVWPTEVEAMLYGHPGIKEACVISIPDARRGESVKAVLVRKSGQDTLSETDVVDWCRENMSAYKVPRRVQFVDALPKSGTGKMMWRQLQEQEWA